MGVNEFVPTNKMLELFAELACDATMRERKLCENVLFLLTGYDEQQMNLV